VTAPKKPTCPHCGEEFSATTGGKIITHDWPRPCRQVCPGSGQLPKQTAADFLDQARFELRLYGFAVAKEMASLLGRQSGTMECPLCQQDMKFSTAPNNGHFRAVCSTLNCVNAME